MRSLPAGTAGHGFVAALLGRLLQIYPRMEEDALWVMEEALRCRCLGAAVGDACCPPRPSTAVSSSRPRRATPWA
ncbi:hypothetical protein UAJ10_02250 [Nitrospirillum sp. BR 11164]|uniref:hypothetical protein n=1 Tax=Nitrospirillum sp. BR 11164 TaxID=3104324 RepID=UPI002AFFAA96|nr:hypothetical protein [Nitrospirillum sp. BR 11164]MEA1647840.1 hypothetical protein [Nitrospirillum sp. BR 11164]